MTLIRLSGPPEMCVTLAEAKAQLQLDHSDDDPRIAGHLRAAQDSIDGAAGWLGRCLTTQQWRLMLDGFPACEVIEIPMPPCQSVDSLTYIDADGGVQAIGDFTVYGIGGAHPARVSHAYGTRWPSTRRQGDAVVIDFTCGYGGFNDVPESVRAAILLMTQALYDGCSLDDQINELLIPHRIW